VNIIVADGKAQRQPSNPAPQPRLSK